MPRIEVIKATDAPPPPRKMGKDAAELLGALQSLKKDEVLKVSPDAGKTVRGVKTSIGRIASNSSIKVESWDDGESVYVKKTS